MSDMRDQDANPAAGDHPARPCQPAPRVPARNGWNSKHPHDIKFRFGPPVEGFGNEAERDESQQRPTDSKTRETTDKQRQRKVVRVTVGHLSEDIDAEIAPLIRATWEADIETVLAYPCDCCGRVCMVFPTHADAAAFLNTVGRFEPGKNALYNRMNQEWASDDPDRDWVCDLHLWDRAYNTDAAENADSMAHDGEPDFDFWFRVQLPQCDLQTVSKRMQAFARRKLKGGMNQTIEDLLEQTRRKARRGE